MKPDLFEYALGVFCLVVLLVNFFLVVFYYHIPALLTLSLVLTSAAFASFLTVIIIKITSK